MRVLHVNDYRSAGGCEVIIETTMGLLREHGVETALFSREDVPGHRRTALGYLYHRASMVALARRVRAFAPDVVHLHNFYHELSPSVLVALDRCRRARPMRVVMTAHDYHLVCPNAGLCAFRGGRRSVADPARLGQWSYLLTRRWDHRGPGHSLLKLLQHAWNYRLHDRRGLVDLIFCPSRFMRTVLEPLGVPLMDLPHPAPAIAAPARKPRDELSWVFAGRVEPEKGLARFLEMLPEDFPGRLTVIGDGSDLPRCRAVCRRRGWEHRVAFAGRLAGPAAQRHIAAAHVLVLPSRTPENAPMSLLEALSAGTAILVCDLGGMKEFVETSGIGWTFAPDDASGLGVIVKAIGRSFAEGRLETVDASKFLASRSAEAYVEGTMIGYGAGGAGAAAPDVVVAEPKRR